MILVFPGASFKHEKNYPILTQQGILLTVSGNYSIKSHSFVSAEYEDRFLLSLTTVPPPTDYETFEVGDNVIIKIDGFQYKNRISEVDNENHNVRLSKELPFGSDTATEIKIKKDFYLYEIDEECPNGFYRFKNGELIIIKDEFQSISIDFASLITRHRNIMGLFEEADFYDYNREALNSVYADLSYLKDVWNILDVNQFRELIIKKILVIVELNYISDSKRFQEDYDKYLKEVINIIKLSGEMSKTNTSDVETSNDDDYGWKLGG